MTHTKRKNRRGPRRKGEAREAPNPIAVGAVEAMLDALEDEWRRLMPSSSSSQATAMRSVFGSMLGLFARQRRTNITIGEGELAVTVRPVDLEAAGNKAMHEFARDLASDWIKRKIAAGVDQSVDELLDEDDDVTAGGNPIRACPEPED